MDWQRFVEERHVGSCLYRAGGVLLGIRRCAAGRSAARSVWLLLVVTLLAACAGSGERGVGESSSPESSLPLATHNEWALDLDLFEGLSEDLKLMNYRELLNGTGVLELGVSKYLAEVGVLDLLDDYLANLPPTAEFISRFELAKGGVALNRLYSEEDEDRADASDGELRRFERQVLSFAVGALESLPESDSAPILHGAFFEALEQCGRGSPWPDVELFLIHDGYGGALAPHLVEPTYGLSYFEYQLLRHQCARYAATYPTLEPEVRDELLAPQREHYAKVILDRLDNELPPVEVPAEYQDEIDNLRASGW